MKAISIFLTAAFLLLFISSCADNIGEENGQAGALPQIPQNSHQDGLPETPQDTPLDMSGFAPPSLSNTPASSDRAEYEYEEYLDGIVITQYNGKSLIVRVPAEIDGMPVRKIGDEAFATGSFKRFLEVYHRVSDAALFNRSTSVEEVYLPDTVTEIGRYAFERCSSLAYIDIPESVTVIGEGAFSSCTGLETIELPSSLTTLGNNAFAKCESLSSIVIPYGVQEIEYNTFFECRGLRSVTLPDSITSIGSYAFKNCISLSSINLPDSVIMIEEEAFIDCSGLNDIILSSNLTTLQSDAFRRCANIVRITIPSSVMQISNGVFANCSKLQFIEFESQTPPPTTRDSAFAGIHRLAEAIVPHGSTEYGEPGSRWNGLTVTIKDAD